MHFFSYAKRRCLWLKKKEDFFSYASSKRMHFFSFAKRRRLFSYACSKRRHFFSYASSKEMVNVLILDSDVSVPKHPMMGKVVFTNWFLCMCGRSSEAGLAHLDPEGVVCWS